MIILIIILIAVTILWNLWNSPSDKDIELYKKIMDDRKNGVI